MLFLFVRRCYSSSSKAWIQRQARDPYVKAAKSQHYRARSAFKLLQMDEKYRLIRPGHVVVDCGAAPGGWTQVAAAKARHVVAVDILPMEPVPNATVIQGDFTSPEVQAQVHEALQGSPVQLVCSDMAPRFTGNHMADHARSLELCESALAFAETVLAPRGAFITKILMGGDEVAFREKLRKRFSRVRQEKPDASRKESTEIFLIATGYKKNNNNNNTE